MKMFVEPELEVVEIQVNDVITTSNGLTNDGDGAGWG